MTNPVEFALAALHMAEMERDRAIWDLDANLRYSNLRGANLSGSDLRGANSWMST